MPVATRALYLSSKTSGPKHWPTQPPIQWVSRVVSLGVNQPGRDAKHEASSTSEVKIWWIYTSISHIHAFMSRTEKD